MNDNQQFQIATAPQSSSNKMCLGISSKFFTSFMAPKRSKDIPKTPIVSSNQVMSPANRIKILKPLNANHKYSSSKQLVNEKVAEDEYYTLTRETNESHRISQSDTVGDKSTASFDNRKNSAHQQYLITNKNHYVNQAQNIDGMPSMTASVSNYNSSHLLGMVSPKSKFQINERYYSQSRHNRGLSQGSESSSILDQADRNFLSKPEVYSTHQSNLLNNQQDAGHPMISQNNEKQMNRNCAKIKVLKPYQIVKKNYEFGSSFRSSKAFDKNIKHASSSVIDSSKDNEGCSTENNLLTSFSEQTGATTNTASLIMLTQDQCQNLDNEVTKARKSTTRDLIKQGSNNTKKSENLASEGPYKISTEISFNPYAQEEVTQSSIKFNRTLKSQQNDDNNNILLHKIASIGKGRQEIKQGTTKHSYNNSYQESKFIKRHISDSNLPIRGIQTEISEDSQDSYMQLGQGANSLRKQGVDFQQTMRVVHNSNSTAQQQYSFYPISTKKNLINSKRIENQSNHHHSTSEYFSTKTFQSQTYSQFNSVAQKQSSNSIVSDFNSNNSINSDNKIILLENSNDDGLSVKSGQFANTKKSFNYYKDHIIQSHKTQIQTAGKNHNTEAAAQQSLTRKEDSIKALNSQLLQQNSSELVNMMKAQEKYTDKIINKISQKTKAEISLTQAEKDVKNLTKAFRSFIEAAPEQQRNSLESSKALLQQHVRVHYLVFGLIRIFREDLKSNQELSSPILSSLQHVRENFKAFIKIVRENVISKFQRKSSNELEQFSSQDVNKAVDLLDLKGKNDKQEKDIKENMLAAFTYLKKICRQAQQNQDRYRQLLKIISLIENQETQQNGKSIRLKSQIKKVLRALKNEQKSETPKENEVQDQKRKRNIFQTVESTITPKSQHQSTAEDLQVNKKKMVKALSEYDKENFSPNLPTDNNKQGDKQLRVKDIRNKGNSSDTALILQQQKSLPAKRCGTQSQVRDENYSKSIIERTRTQIPSEKVISNYQVTADAPGKTSLARSCSVPQKDIRLPSKMPFGIKYTLVLDLDETLVHYDPQIRNYRVRPDAQRFVQQMSRYYEVVIFTAGLKDYADWILDDFDKAGYISHRLYRDSTLHKNGIHIKDLSRLGRDLTKTIIIDNIEDNFQSQPNNGIPIKSWYIDPLDKELEKLTQFLKQVVRSNTDDVRTEVINYKQSIKVEMKVAEAPLFNRPQREHIRVR